MRFTEIGQQLRAYRLESGLRAEEIAAQLGVSRAALYRYEKGDVIKLDTIQRLAELLKISPLSLLGIGTEYYSRPIAFFERIRQIEETADQLLMLDGPICYLTTSDAYDSALDSTLAEADAGGGGRQMIEQVAGVLAARKRLFQQRRPGIISLMSAPRVARFLEQGIAPFAKVEARTRQHCRRVAAEEVQAIANMVEADPMGLQFGVLTRAEFAGGFVLLRARERATLVVNPFRPDLSPTAPGGVAMITAADEAIAAHQRVAEALWGEAVKGAGAVAHLRAMLTEHAIQ